MNKLIFLVFYLATVAYVSAHHLHWKQGNLNYDILGGERIVGGQPANPGELPYILSMRSYDRHFCGATLVQDPASGFHFGLTAGHCIGLEGISVAGGDVSLYNDSATRQVRKIEKALVHPEYHINSFGVPVHDIAILLFASSFRENKYVKPLVLPTLDIVSEENLVISGWGKTSEHSSLSSHLQFVHVPLIENSRCADLYSRVFGSSEIIQNFNICAGEEHGGKDSCQGDSGGPLATGGTNPVLVGVTSWGIGCARPHFPGVYTRVSTNLDWIATVLAENNK